jgi:hypothetical protein
MKMQKQTIAAPATQGGNKIPSPGYNIPAANGIPLWEKKKKKTAYFFYRLLVYFLFLITYRLLAYLSC